jgi:hypothetical protein
MLRVKRISVPPPNSASIVRHRLLHDRLMRRHSSAVIELSPVEQRRHAVQVAHCFKGCYLADITYHEDCQMTVAVVRAVNTRQPAHEIWVDSTGNVNVYRRDNGSFRNIPGQMVMIPGLLLIALSVLLLAIYL